MQPQNRVNNIRCKAWDIMPPDSPRSLPLHDICRGFESINIKATTRTQRKEPQRRTPRKYVPWLLKIVLAYAGRSFISACHNKLTAGQNHCPACRLHSGQAVHQQQVGTVLDRCRRDAWTCGGACSQHSLKKCSAQRLQTGDFGQNHIGSVGVSGLKPNLNAM